MYVVDIRAFSSCFFFASTFVTLLNCLALSVLFVYNNNTVNVATYITATNLSFIAVAMNSRDRYEIIGLHKISYSIKNLVEVFT